MIRRGPELADSINGTLRSYLLGAVRNRSLTALEKDRERSATDEEITELVDDVDVAELVVTNALVAVALEPLSDNDRYVLEQTVFAARSNRDVGREIGMTGQGVGKVRKRVLGLVAKRLIGEGT